MRKKLFVVAYLILGMVTFSATAKKPVKKPVKVEKEIVKVKEDTAPEYKAVLVGDINGNILYGENMKEKLPLASTTKAMTMLITFEELKKGNVSLNDDVVISANAARMGGAMIPLKVGDVFKLEELIKATAIHSANNAAYAVAEHVGKGFDNFIKMMNDKAFQLGIGGEVEFYTPAGLPPKMTKRGMDKGSAKGMYKIILEAKKYPEYLEMAGMKNTRIHNNEIFLRNKNHLLGKEGIYGLKTGFHNTSGYNILVIGEKDNWDLCYVVLGGRTAKLRDDKVLELDRRIRENYKKQEIVRNDISLAEVPVVKGSKELIPIYPESNYSRVVKKTDNVSVKIERAETVTAPVKKKDVIGKYKVFVNGEMVHQGALITDEAVEKKSLLAGLI